MSTEETARQDPLDSMLEALLKERLEPGSKPKAASRAEDAVVEDVTEALRIDLVRAVSQASPFEKALLVSALAPALAEALAPALAEALAPAIVRALGNITAAERPGQEATLIGEAPKPPSGPGASPGGKPATKQPSASSEGSGKQERT